MRNLLDDLRHAPTPLALVSRDNLVQQIKATYVSLFNAASGRTEFAAAEASHLRRYALWLEDAVLSNDLSSRDMESALNVASTAYEFAGRLNVNDAPTSIFAAGVNDLLRSALLGSLGSYQAQALQIARRIRRQLVSLPTASIEDECHRLSALGIVSFVGRESQRSFSIATRLRHLSFQAVDEMKAGDAENHRYVELDLAITLGIGCGTASAGLLAGSSRLLTAGMDQIERASVAAREGEDAQHYWLSRSLLAAVRPMFLGSMHLALRRAEISADYRHALAREGVLELWGPQLEVIERGLLDDGRTENIVVTIPPGAGKTLIAELAILSSLKSDRPAWALYVTPSRALVSQVSTDLRRRLRHSGITVRTILAGGEPNGSIGAELELLTAPKSVTVVTPEKLDTYYRNAKDLFDSCALVIFDEVHKVSERGRGALLESLITRFLVLQPNARIVVLSGVMSNHQDFVAWLGTDSAASILTKRRPTRQIRAVAVRHDFDRHEPHEQEDLEGDIEVQLPSLFAGHFTEREYASGWREDRNASRSTRNDHAISLATTLSRLPGTTLVFVQRVVEAESCCRRLEFDDGSQNEEERKLLAQFIAAELGDGHELVKQCRRGVAFHHSRLPSSVQRALELGLERGWLRVVFATPTLREGLNTPATNVIVAGHTYYDQAISRTVPISEMDFENLAGRAGRPLRENEGLVALIPDSLAQARALQSGGKYLLVGDEALRVRSQLGELGDWLRRSRAEILDMPTEEQSLLMGLKAAGLDDEDQLSSFFGQSLWSQQVEDENETRTAIEAGARAFVKAKSSLGEDRLVLASRTGLSLTSTNSLVEGLALRSEVFSDDSIGTDATISGLLELCLRLPEIRRGALERQVDWRAHLEPMYAWIAGHGYEHIREVGRASGALQDSSDVGATVRYCSDLSTWLSWGFGACYLVLESMVVKALSPTVGTLPLLVKYGVPSLSAAFISLLGVSDRSAAQTLAEHFDSTGRPVSLSEIQAWVDDNEGSFDQMITGSDLRTELLRRQVFGGGVPPLPYMFARLRARGTIKTGQFLSFQRENGSLLARDELNTLIGEVEVRDVEEVVRFSEGALHEIAGVAMGGEESEGIRLAVIRLSPDRDLP